MTLNPTDDEKTTPDFKNARLKQFSEWRTPQMLFVENESFVSIAQGSYLKNVHLSCCLLV